MFISEIVSYGIFFEFWTYKNATVENPNAFMSRTDYSVYLTFTSIILIMRIFNETHLKYKIFCVLIKYSKNTLHMKYNYHNTPNYYSKRYNLKMKYY